jgi:hypothetical protein
VAAVERWRCRRQSAASTVAAVTNRVESGGDIESFGMKSEMTQDELLFIGSKISAVILV